MSSDSRFSLVPVQKLARSTSRLVSRPITRRDFFFGDMRACSYKFCDLFVLLVARGG